MSIATKTGDAGTTGLMYNRRVPKHHRRVEAYGAVDELNAALGLARAAAQPAPLRQCLLEIQHHLVVVMGELATLPSDLRRYQQDGFRTVGPELAAALDDRVAEIEPGLGRFRDWAMPGETALAAALDFARTVCRRAERRVCALPAAGQRRNPHLVVYLNRLADLLWLLARDAERRPARPRTSERKPPRTPARSR